MPTETMTWMRDGNGNKCSIEYFGTQEAASTALDSLKGCRDCINCSDCSRCSGCSDCSDCSTAPAAPTAPGCSDCSRCSRCPAAPGAPTAPTAPAAPGAPTARCSRCSRCSGCSDCSDCSRCSGAPTAPTATAASAASAAPTAPTAPAAPGAPTAPGAQVAPGAPNIARLWDKKDLKGDPESTWNGPPPIPTIASIHKKIYDAASIPPEALEMDTWHTCGTTHCRGGWAVHLAGDPGYALEKFHGTLLAAQLIYRESGYAISPVRFFDSNEDALADMKRLHDFEIAMPTETLPAEDIAKAQTRLNGIFEHGGPPMTMQEIVDAEKPAKRTRLTRGPSTRSLSLHQMAC